MSLIIPRHDKNAVINLLQMIVERLAFPKLDSTSRSATLEHFAAMRADKDDMNVLCQLATDPLTGKTAIQVICTFNRLVKQ